MEIIFLQLKKCVRDWIDHLSKRKRNDKKVALKTNCIQGKKVESAGIEPASKQVTTKLSSGLVFVCFSRDQ